MTDQTIPPAKTGPAGISDLLALGFGTTVAMWAVGYAGRFPSAEIPSWLLLVLLLLCLFAGGFVAGRSTHRGVKGGLYAGLLAGMLNLLILGSLLGGSQPNQVVPSALWWIPGSLLVSAIVAALGAAAGRATAGAADAGQALTRSGLAAFATVAAAATYLLLLAGGIVTSHEAGLAVVDWPNSYGYNMFLYPLSRMTGGIYYEHVHRLLGSLVGLTTLVLAIHLQAVEKRRWIKRLALVALLAVIVQGILGGLRVTGRFTLSDSAQQTAPNLTLAIVHGITGQLFFALMVALAIFTTRRWREPGARQAVPGVALDRSLSRILVAALVFQLVLGAILRHVAGGLLIHISMAVVVILLAITTAARSWGHYGQIKHLQRLANGLFGLIVLQLALGLGALIATGAERTGSTPPAGEVILTTAHQAVGALLLACAVAVMLWIHRLSEPAA